MEIEPIVDVNMALEKNKKNDASSGNPEVRRSRKKTTRKKAIRKKRTASDGDTEPSGDSTSAAATQPRAAQLDVAEVAGALPQAKRARTSKKVVGREGTPAASAESGSPGPRRQKSVPKRRKTTRTGASTIDKSAEGSTTNEGDAATAKAGDALVAAKAPASLTTPTSSPPARGNRRPRRTTGREGNTEHHTEQPQPVAKVAPRDESGQPGDSSIKDAAPRSSRRSSRGRRGGAGRSSRPNALPATEPATTTDDLVNREPEPDGNVAIDVEKEEAQPRRRAGRRSRGGRGRGKSNSQARTASEPRSANEARTAPAPAAPSRHGPPPNEQRKATRAAHEVRRDGSVPPVGRGRHLLINAQAGDECRVAILSDGRLEELFIERASANSCLGNIYKGRVTNVEPSIQAVFVDFGQAKNGFLHISDVQPQYFPDHKGETEEVGRKIPRSERPPIQRCFRRGQEVIVQVSKDGLGTKGPTLTTYLSIPGRFLVMMPGMSRHGVSRKIEDEEARRKMRDIMKDLTLPGQMGFILRTAGLDRNKRDLQRDLNYLSRLWKTVAQRVRELPTPTELYQESDLVIRTIRDIYSADFESLVIDDADAAKKAQDFLQIAMPRSRITVELYADREPLFHRYGIEEEIERINLRHVPLRSGGSLVIDSTEALVAIDVNSGKFRATADMEETAYTINMEAATEIARQLRLRDLGGLIVCDFIDMRMERHKRDVERALRDELKKHKERARILRMSGFGIIEMTRQRQGPSLKRNLYFDCPHCKGSGLVKMPESVMLDVVRTIQLSVQHDEVQTITATVSSEVALQILNSKRAVLNRIEVETGKTVLVHGDASFTGDQVLYRCEDAAGRPVTVMPGNGTRRR